MKNPDILREAADDLLVKCEDAIRLHKEELRVKQSMGEVITSAMRQKAVLINFRGVANINAETTVQRAYSLRALYDHMSRVKDPLSWGVPAEHLKPTMNWTVDWGAFEDSRLLVGVHRYGFGSWELIQEVSRSAIFITAQVEY
jgi:chromodomain-helicase-DNA-binding protein 1